MVRVARERRRLDVQVVWLRDFAEDNHRTIDDYPYGGGPGIIEVKFFFEDHTPPAPFPRCGWQWETHSG
jgi:tRNA (guanine37-N1)-methyltransferase